MTKAKDKFRDIIHRFSRVVDKFSQLEAKPRRFGCRHMLHCVEIHIIEAIGEAGCTSVTDLSQRLGVTKGAISQKISKLSEMNLIRKSQDGADRRNVSIKLTAEGEKAFRGHEQFHQDFFKAYAKENKSLSLKELAVFEKGLNQMEECITRMIDETPSET